MSTTTATTAVPALSSAPPFVFPLPAGQTPYSSPSRSSPTSISSKSHGHSRNLSVSPFPSSLPCTSALSSRPASLQPSSLPFSNSAPSEPSLISSAKARSPARKHAHRRSAALSRDFLADLRGENIPMNSASSSAESPTLSDDRRSSSPCNSSSASIDSSVSFPSVSSTSTTPPSRTKVMFSSAVEFIPSHSTTTSTSTTTTLTTTRLSQDLSSPEPVPQQLRTHKKVRSWSFIRFRRKNAEDGASDENEYPCEDNTEDEDEEFDTAFTLPATPVSSSNITYTDHFMRTATPEPMIDLDAALGPSGTPPLLSGSWSGSSSYTYHRRSESAPGLITWDGTRSVDFATFSRSMSRALDGPFSSSNSSGSSSGSASALRPRPIKHQMSAVAELDESYEETMSQQHTKSDAPDAAQVPLADTENRRSVWEDFVSSFNDTCVEVAPSVRSDSADSRDAVLVVDNEEGEAVFLGEPGPAVHHDLSSSESTDDSAECDSNSTVSDDSLKLGSGCDFSTEFSSKTTIRQRSPQGKRRSLIFGLKHAMTRSQSAGNLLHIPSSEDEKDETSTSSETKTKTNSGEKIGKNKFGSRSQGNLPVPGTPPIELPKLMEMRGAALIGSSEAHTAAQSEKFGLRRVRKPKGIASRMWDWVRSSLVTT
ncbi:uncharacterized protein V1516DRAFT_621660 [Lipomyces oligophaga]|uniref:uncharacterized protein n=1 Tax=Lipomyces oligophaga TaxID=45792 RepID=UPI0034CFAD1D